MDNQDFNEEDEDLLNEDLVEIDDDGVHEEGEESDAELDENGMEIIDEEVIQEVEVATNDNASFTFTEHSDSVCCVAIHPFDHFIVATGGCDDRAYIWRFSKTENPTTDEQWCFPLLGHSDTVTSISFNFNGKLLLTGSYDGTIRIWDVQSKQQIQILEGPEDIEWASWHPKGNAVIAGSKDGTVWLWLTHNGQCIQVFAGHDGLVSAGCFANEGKIICTGGEDGSVRLWNPKNGVCRSVFEKNPQDEEMVTYITSEGDYLAAGFSSGKIKVILISSAKQVLLLLHSETEAEGQEDNVQSVECLAFSPECRWLASGGMNKAVTIWDISSGSRRVNCVHDDGVVSVVWHPTLPFFCSASLDSRVRVWDARSGNCLQTLEGHTNFVLSMVSVFNAEDSSALIATVSDDQTSKIFEVDFQSLSRANS